MSKKILICADSTSDLSPDLIARYGVTIMPLHVRLGDEERLDGVDVFPDDLFAYYQKTGKLPATSAGMPLDYEEFFKKHLTPDTSIVHFHLSSDMSATYNNARMVAETLDDVHSVDSRNLSTGIGLLVIEASIMAQSGQYTAAEIAERCRVLAAHVNTSFIVDTLEFLWKGGRCSGVAALGANLLRLKPCIEVRDGKMDVSKKYRGKLEAVLDEYVDERLKGRGDLVLDRIFVTHSGMDKPELVDRVVARVKSIAPFKEVLVTRAGCSVSTHCGPNTLGLLFFTK